MNAQCGAAAAMWAAAAMEMPADAADIGLSHALSFSFLYPLPRGVQKPIFRMRPTGLAHGFDQLSLDINLFQNAPGLFH
jgi:hypothetical protein